MCLIYIEEKTAQRKIPVVLDFLHHRHKACIASGSPLAQLAQLALRRWLAYLPAPVPCTMQKIFSSRKKWSYDQNNPPIFWSRLCEACKISYFRQFPWVSIKKSSCLLIENAVACYSGAHSSEKQTLVKSWLPCHQGNKVKWPACFSRWFLVVDFEGDSFRGQKAPTGSFSVKTLPVSPEYHAFCTSNGTIRQTFEQNSACRSSEWFYQPTFSLWSTFWVMKPLQ